jgi:hypothetical protein
VHVLRTFAAAHAETAALAPPAVEVIKFTDALLHLELSTRDVARSFAQRSLEILDLEEGFGVLALSRLGQLPSKA